VGETADKSDLRQRYVAAISEYSDARAALAQSAANGVIPTDAAVQREADALVSLQSVRRAYFST
jgi:hypothetical protein